MALLRAAIFRSTYDWIVEHSMTPYLLVNATEEDVLVPEAYVEEGQIVLNLSPHAIRDFLMDAEGISLIASFSGEAFSIFVPYEAVEGLYSKESGQGVYADESQGAWGLLVNELDEETGLPEPPESSSHSTQKAAITERLAKSGLKVVK
jgi:stringent starvation protein B